MAERLILDYIPAPTIAGHDFGEIIRFMNPSEMKMQAARCPGCGAPSCQIGCPIGNSIGDFHTLIARGDFQGAADLRFNQTSVLAGLIGSVCPQKDNGLCEDTNNCVAGRGDGESVMIANIESSMNWLSLQMGWINPIAPLSYVQDKRKSAAVIGSGPAGLAAAEELVRLGWRVTIYESKPEIGGLWSIGIPNFKLNHELLKGTLDLYKHNDYIDVVTNMKIGEHASMAGLAAEHDLIVAANGAQIGKSQPHVPVWDTPGVYQAMRDYLRPQSLINLGASAPPFSNMHGKDVIVIGLGYTGVDCINTAYYQGAKSITVLSARELDSTFNEYMRNEIRLAETKGAKFIFGAEPLAFEYDHGSKKCILNIEDKSGNGSQLSSDAIILSKGFDIKHIIKPENEHWAFSNDYHYKKGRIDFYNGTPVITVGDAALRSTDRLVVKAAAQSKLTVRQYHYEQYPHDNRIEAFVGGRNRRLQGLNMR